MASASAAEARRWEAVVEADRALFERVAPNGTTAFPEGRAPWALALEGPEILIGRSAADRGVRPAIDLSGDLEDIGVSREHALLVAQADGSYAVVDLGSRNGTTLNGRFDPAPGPRAGAGGRRRPHRGGAVDQHRRAGRRPARHRPDRAAASALGPPPGRPLRAPNGEAGCSPLDRIPLAGENDHTRDVTRCDHDGDWGRHRGRGRSRGRHSGSAPEGAGGGDHPRGGGGGPRPPRPATDGGGRRAAVGAGHPTRRRRLLHHLDPAVRDDVVRHHLRRGGPGPPALGGSGRGPGRPGPGPAAGRVDR